MSQPAEYMAVRNEWNWQNVSFVTLKWCFLNRKTLYVGDTEQAKNHISYMGKIFGPNIWSVLRPPT